MRESNKVVSRCPSPALLRFAGDKPGAGPELSYLLSLVNAALACAVACPRAHPATAFAPLSHMLTNGFFFIHGFAIVALSGLKLL
jgi:hypothetical protein